MWLWIKLLILLLTVLFLLNMFFLEMNTEIYVVEGHVFVIISKYIENEWINKSKFLKNIQLY